MVSLLVKELLSGGSSVPGFTDEEGLALVAERALVVFRCGRLVDTGRLILWPTSEWSPGCGRRGGVLVPTCSVMMTRAPFPVCRPLVSDVALPGTNAAERLAERALPSAAMVVAWTAETQVALSERRLLERYKRGEVSLMELDSAAFERERVIGVRLHCELMRAQARNVPGCPGASAEVARARLALQHFVRLVGEAWLMPLPEPVVAS